MITRWREAAATHLKSCARPHGRRTRRLRRYLVSQSKQLVVDEPYLFQAAVL